MPASTNKKPVAAKEADLPVPHILNFAPDNAAHLKKIVICLHGFGGGKQGTKIDRLMAELSPNGVGVIAIDLPGHGDNKSTLSIDNCVRDIAHTVEFVRRFKKPVSLYGSSFGGFCALSYLENTKERFDRILLSVPAINLYECHEAHLGEANNGVTVTAEYLKTVAKYDIIGGARALPPLDIIYAENDSVIDNQKIFELAKHVKCNLYEIKGSDHWFDVGGRGPKTDAMIKIAIDVLG